ncbi:MAG: hypothetical protein A2748_01770 [Candidatus Wildermuthbacteria bacterium RIFCSPHIGHO2_01_FULL_45_20]|uniref:Putative gluconeogenesis factor n=1 Tax=Candidatus Wildermuthbacteria bacterium RIFCSPHIGHO2_02_FULL_45_25 TaxID=1802450 RepID=A0A1G2R4H6_9BACT|nr:MAG: hypothetical protein A2748_01770 [Candidatus Wildermuthbacteria bacterium RIFCSPHIGHO2_01_FULL_45_20]OHA67764.1 MAG: hypothetical protein A3C04_03270 [Candidatus Wildermuthbacteria bacterium RIFCSPHIGHO2_02_FULL_45_25]
MKRQKRIVVIGGGTGTYTVLSGLKKHRVYLTAVVAMADDGGSTRVLREEFGVLPPGSVRPAMVALSSAEKSLADLFNYRFEGNNGLSGHNFGNLFITALTKQLGSFEKAIEEAGKILDMKGEVIPSTLDNCTLVARLENGQIIRGETNIDVPQHDGSLRIQEVWLEHDCKANGKAVEAIEKADMIVIGPGDLFTSILPNILLKPIAEAIRKSKGKKVFICNLMTKFGETNNFTAFDFAKTLEQYMGQGVLTHIIVNKKRPSPARIKKYEKEQAEVVEYDVKALKAKKLKVVEADLVRPVGFIRHDSDTLATILCKL